MAHPVLQMSKARQQVWLKEATPQDYFDMITLLARLYAKMVYDGEKLKTNSLFVDYQEHQKSKVKEIMGGGTDEN